MHITGDAHHRRCTNRRQNREKCHAILQPSRCPYSRRALRERQLVWGGRDLIAPFVTQSSPYIHLELAATRRAHCLHAKEAHTSRISVTMGGKASELGAAELGFPPPTGGDTGCCSFDVCCSEEMAPRSLKKHSPGCEIWQEVSIFLKYLHTPQRHRERTSNWEVFKENAP